VAIPVAQKLLETAQSGERKLTTSERRHVVAYLMATQPDVTNVELAETFGVTERTLRMDKQHIREEKARFIKEDDIGLVIADIALDFERQVRDIERSKAKAKLGSDTFLKHCTSAMELRLKMVKSLQDIGYLPKNLGNMTVESYEYKAVVHRDGSVETRPLNYFDGEEPRVLEGQVVETRQLPSGTNANTSTGELPAAVESTVPDEENQDSQADPSESPSTTG
jgi:predicted transcriptional regulator